MLDNNGRFLIENYRKSSVFGSFLPGISGETGIPVWSFYANRGQAITSFGIENKDHSIMEFNPAHLAYQLVSTHGFRTFMRIDGKYVEAFTCDENPQNMYIAENSLEIEEVDLINGITISVTYFTLPDEPLGALVRRITIRNDRDEKRAIEIIDGMPEVVPYGVSLSDLKEMGQTVKAWMQVEDVSSGRAYYRVRASIVDSISVSKIEEGNFAFAYRKGDSRILPVIADPDIIFSYDNSLMTAIGFKDGGLKALLEVPQNMSNNIPSAFFGYSGELSKRDDDGDSFTINEMFGSSSDKLKVEKLANKYCNDEAFEKAFDIASSLTRDITSVIDTKTGNHVFDEYCKSTYLDNVLRGGFPEMLGDKVFYLYSRKHGDMERDYNYFRMAPEFFSQGNANFRDILQNRRSDVLFAPFTKDINIKTFFNLIQTDGFNPLHIKETTYSLNKDSKAALEKLIDDKTKIDALLNALEKPYTPGHLAKLLDEYGIANDAKTIKRFVEKIVENSDTGMDAEFGEGYWTDHWEYAIDLVESYLRIFPENQDKLLFDEADYTYFDTQMIVNPRYKRYEETPNGLRQYHTIEKPAGKEIKGASLMVGTRTGEVYKTTLAEKMLLLCAVKFMTLDSYGMGVEMEGGRPGWYDALNGLPGLFGSSMCETAELCRHIEFMLAVLEKHEGDVILAEEVKALFGKLHDTIPDTFEPMTTWNNFNDIKEEYRARTMMGFSGDTASSDTIWLKDTLERMLSIVKQGIARAKEYTDGVLMPSYFSFEAKDYEKRHDGIRVNHFVPTVIPTFLEGPVHDLRLEHTKAQREAIYQSVLKSGLYDAALKMYKVNVSLSDASFELGRARAFTPGWLENESIWLHMEYKYLLELIKNGMYSHFIADFKTTAIPFLDPLVYGRSTLENSSFIASSVNPNPNIHGKGFVSRLSGSTAEFIDIWQIMMFGIAPFVTDENANVFFEPKPLIPGYLLDGTKIVEAKLLGATKTTYKVNQISDYIPGEYNVSNIEVVFDDGTVLISSDGRIAGKEALLIREGKAKEINVTLLIQ